MDERPARTHLRLAAVAVIGNEADIIDAWLDHHLALLDALLVVSHASRDGTGERIAARAAAGAPILLTEARGRSFRQSALLTELVRTQAPRVRERAIRAVRAPGSSTVWHWAMPSQQLAAGRVLDAAALEEIALRYYAFAGPEGPGEPPAGPATCEDPIRPEREPQ